MVKRILITQTKRVRKEGEMEGSVFREFPTLYEYAMEIPKVVMIMGVTRRVPHHGIPITAPDQLEHFLQPSPRQLELFLAMFDQATRIEATIFFGVTVANVGVEVCFYRPA